MIPTINTYLKRDEHYLSYKRIFIILALVNSAVFFTFWFLELQFGFRPEERVGWFFYGNDAHSYLDPIENLISNGTYAMNSGPTAFRMPGFLPFYGPLYFLFGKSLGLNLFALLNLVFHIGTTAIVFRLSHRFVSKIMAFALAFGFALYPRLTMYGYMGMSEVLAAFAMIFCVYHLLLWKSDKKASRAIWISVFASVFVLLKPIGILFIAALGVGLLIHMWLKKYPIRNAFKLLTLFFLTPTLVLSIWTYRNYQTFEAFIPLTPTLSSKGADQAFRSFCRRTGQQFQSWQGKDARVWFVPPSNYMYDSVHAASDPFPSYIYTSEFNLDTMRNLRSDWHLMLSGQLSSEDSLAMDKSIENRFWKYAESFIDEHPFHFMVTIRLTFLKDFLMIKDSFSPFKQNTLMFKALRGYFMLSYYGLLLGLFAGLVALFFVKSFDARLIVGTALAFILIHVAMGRIENRYLLPAIPLFAIGFAILFKAYTDKLGKIKEID